MKSLLNIGVIGGADGPTQIYVSSDISLPVIIGIGAAAAAVVGVLLWRRRRKKEK